MVHTSFVMVAVGGMLCAANAALEVITPSDGMTVIADQTYTVEWTGTGDDKRYEIDLYYCNSYCMEGECGEWVTALCPYGETGCPDNEGDYDVIMPEPMVGTGSGKQGRYKVRVADVNDESLADCSDPFYLLPSNEAPQAGDADGPSLHVTSPRGGDLAYAGEEYTVEFEYDNGLGSSVNRFKIDLYKADGSGDCGTWVTSICDKPSLGCKDSMGDYDVEIPEDTAAGDYSIRVGVFGDDSVFGCSDVFEVEAAEDERSTDAAPGISTSYSYRF